jgi:hypothetical protein
MSLREVARLVLNRGISIRTVRKERKSIPQSNLS